jgi:hypothetical protein
MVDSQSTPRCLSQCVFRKRQPPHQLYQDSDPSQVLWYRGNAPRYIEQSGAKGLNSGTAPYRLLCTALLRTLRTLAESVWNAAIVTEGRIGKEVILTGLDGGHQCNQT